MSHHTARILLGLALLAHTAAVAAQGQSRNQPIYLPLTIGIPAKPTPEQPIHTGEGTYYDADGSGNCMFDPSPEDLMVAAMNRADYTGAALCGAFVQITGPNGSVTVRIVDQCPECLPGDIDMSPQAFDRIAPRIAGRVPISWRIVSPDIAGPVRYRFKEGSSQWWTAVQIRNHRNPIAKLEYRDASGQFIAMERQDYNYFLRPGDNQGLGVGPYIFRVTDIYGNSFTDANIPLTVGGVVSGANQFPKLP